MKIKALKNQIICGDCLEVLPKLGKVKMIFADPPDNLGVKYDGFLDKWGDKCSYAIWLSKVIEKAMGKSSILWLSYNAIHRKRLYYVGYPVLRNYAVHEFIWRFTFGQHNKHDCGNGYRPILRIMRPSAKLYPDAIRVPSARQTLYNDKRANPAGRVPDDVWEFSRICGTFNERRSWHPNQHPKALLERIIKFSCKPGDTMIDMFAGSGTSHHMASRLGVNCIGIEISPFYCGKIAEETGAQLIEEKAAGR